MVGAVGHFQVFVNSAMTIECMYDLQHYVDVVAQNMVYRCIRYRRASTDQGRWRIKNQEYTGNCSDMEAMIEGQVTLILI